MNITIFLFIIITIFIIIQFILLFNFLFKYIYNFQYYNSYIKICKNNFIEYETSRYNFNKEYNSYYLSNNKFNKINNYLVLIIVCIFSIVFSIIISYYIFNIINDINKHFNNNTILKIFINIIFYSIILHILSYIAYLLGINFDNNVIFSEYIINKVNSNLHYYIFGLYAVSILILFNYKANFSLPFFIILLIIFEFIKFLVSYNIKILKLRNNIKSEKVYDNYDIKLVEKASIAKNEELSTVEETKLKQQLGRVCQTKSENCYSFSTYPHNDIRSDYNNILIDYFKNIFGIRYYYQYKKKSIDKYLLTEDYVDNYKTSLSPTKKGKYYISTLYKNIKQDKINFNIFIIQIFIIIFIIILFINNITNLKFNEYLSFINCFKFDIDCKYLIFNFNESKKILNFFIFPVIVLFILLVIIESTYRYNDIINQYIIEQPNLLYKNDILHLRHEFDNILDNNTSDELKKLDSSGILDDNITNSIYLTLYNNIFSYFLSKNDIGLLLGFRWKIIELQETLTLHKLNTPSSSNYYSFLADYLYDNIDKYKNKQIEFTNDDYINNELKLYSLISERDLKKYYIESTLTDDDEIHYYKPIENYSEKYHYMNFIPEFKNNNIDISSQEYDINYYINNKCDKKNIFYSSHGNSKDNINYDLIIYILNDIIFNNFKKEDFKNYIRILIYKSFKNIENNKNYLGNYKLSNDNSKNNNLYFIHKINNFYYKNSKINTDDDKSYYEYSKILLDSELELLKNIKTTYNNDNNIVKYIDTIIDFDKSKSSYEEIMDALYKIKKQIESDDSLLNIEKIKYQKYQKTIDDLILKFKIDINNIDIKYNNDTNINSNINSKINDIINYYDTFRDHIRINLDKIKFNEQSGPHNINNIYKLLLEADKDDLINLISIIIDNLITLFDDVKTTLENLKNEDRTAGESIKDKIDKNIIYNYNFYHEINNEIKIKLKKSNNYNNIYDLRTVDDQINKYIHLRQKNSQYTFLLLLIIYILSYLILNKIKL